MYWQKNKKNDFIKSIDGLKRRKQKKQKKIVKFKIESDLTKKIQKSLRVVLIVIAAIFVSIGILYLIPQTRSYINLARMMWSGKYLVLFQNNAELRPTGGFIGSFAVVHIKYGRIKNTFFETNIYKRDNEFDRRFQFIPKDEKLENISPAGYVTMRDSNWALDFSTAAKQVAWFYKQEGGTDVDGAIAIDIDFFRDLLDIIGPINLAKYDLKIEGGNFLQYAQQEIEKNYFKDEASAGVDEPKSILADMMPIVIARIKDNKNWSKLYTFFFDELQKKHLLLYSNNRSIQSTIVENNWGGTIYSDKRLATSDQYKDYLYINNSNLGANKSSIYSYENIEINIHQTDNDLIHQIKIIKDYPDVDLSNLEYFNPNNTKNKNYTRVLIPTGSTDINVYENGNDLGEYTTTSKEGGKTKVGFWTTTEKGSQSIYEISYNVPINKTQEFNGLYFQKQPGAINQNLKITIDGQTKYEGEFVKDLEIK